MKIVNRTTCTPQYPLRAVSNGKTFRFVTNLHPKHLVDDVFIRNNVIGGYRPEGRRYDGTIGVTNLRTGALAFVTRDRPVDPVEAEVCILPAK